jgi:hypothetical protein
LDWLAFIFGLFAKIWYFFSNFKFEQNWQNQNVSAQLKVYLLLKSSSRRKFFNPLETFLNRHWSIGLFDNQQLKN